MADSDTNFNESRNTCTLPPCMDPHGPHLWRVMISAEGDIYYQNNITKKTQSTPPVFDQSENSRSDMVPFIQMTNRSHHATQIAQTTTLQQICNTEPKRIRKLWDKQHFIWFFGMAFSIFDIFTDIEVAIAWLHLSSLCSQFTCFTPNEARLPVTCAILLIACSSLGFMLGSAIKYIELKLLYDSYKIILTEDELTEKQHQLWKVNLKYGWMPLVIEDVVSIVLLDFTYISAEIIAIGDLDTKYIRSLCASLASIVFTLLNTYRKKRELAKRKLFPQLMSCYCGWCCCLGCCFMPPVFCLLWMQICMALSIHKYIYVDIVDYTKFTPPYSYAYMERFTCPAYVPKMVRTWPVPPKVGDDTFVGKLEQKPEFVYSNCSGDVYDYDLVCRGSTGTNGQYDIQLQCTLNWEYIDVNGTAPNMTDDADCYNYDEDMCGFHVDLGVCEDYTIKCDNDWEFFNGNPLMWVCFQQCSMDS
eukprot:118058_1